MRAGFIDRRDPFAEPAALAAAGAEQAGGAAGPSADDTSECKVFVGNLPFDTEPSTLESIFGTFGDIIGVNVRHDRATGKPRGFAFVTFRSDASAAAAIKALSGHKLGGRVLTVNKATIRGVAARNAKAAEAAKQAEIAKWGTVAPAVAPQDEHIKVPHQQPKKKPKKKKKTSPLCKNWRAGDSNSCRFGNKCRFRHHASGGGGGGSSSSDIDGAGKSWSEWAVLPPST